MGHKQSSPVGAITNPVLFIFSFPSSMRPRVFLVALQFSPALCITCENKTNPHKGRVYAGSQGHAGVLSAGSSPFIILETLQKIHKAKSQRHGLGLRTWYILLHQTEPSATMPSCLQTHPQMLDLHLYNSIIHSRVFLQNNSMVQK